MDTEWALRQLRQFLELTPPASSSRIVVAPSQQAVAAAAYVAEQVLDRVLPGWKVPVPVTPQTRWKQHRDACRRAIAKIELAAELHEHLGDDAPQLSASHLHPWVWDGARSLWQSGHYGEAILAASRTINAHAQNKIGRRDIGETELLQGAFSPNPPKAGEVRLRLSDDDGSKTFKSRHAGAAGFAHGCYGALRNPGSHEVQDELSQDEALEQLAAFSVLARWIDQAKVVKP